jgi:chemotaxis protein CheX
MDANFVNPFLSSLANVLPQLGMTDIKRGSLSLKSNILESTGIAVNVGIVGDLKGNIVYALGTEDAKKIASIMMCGMPVVEFDEMAQSAINELTNMLTANAATGLSSLGINIDISTPTLIYGNFKTILKGLKVICIGMLINEMKLDVNIAIEKN